MRRSLSQKEADQNFRLGYPAPQRVAMLDVLHLVYWNESLNDWDTHGVYADPECMATSDDPVCTFCGYTTHFTTFTLGVRITLNTIDPAKVRRQRTSGLHPSWFKMTKRNLFAPVVLGLNRTRPGSYTWAPRAGASWSRSSCPSWWLSTLSASLSCGAYVAKRRALAYS